MPFPKGYMVVTVGLAAITGAAVALGFAGLYDGASTWFVILVVVVAVGVSPVLASWLSPGLKYVALFPISVLVSLSIASAIHGPLSYDSEPIGFVIMLGLIYGGGASLAFCVGWIARQYLRRLRGHRMPMSPLAMASLVMVCCSVALSVLFITIPLASVSSSRTVYWSAILGPIGLIGVVAGAAVIWSDCHRGRWGFLGLGLSLLYLGASVAPPLYLATAHWYGPVALALVALAIWNVLRWKGAGAY